MQHGDWLDRYCRGEREAIWSEMTQCGPVAGEALAEASRVARETMRRARSALEELAQRLQTNGYSFVRPDTVLLPPVADVADRIARLESRVGPLPVALCAFWEEVGSVDFTGAHPDWPLPAYCHLPGFPRPRSTASKDLIYADPIVVFSFKESLSDYEDRYSIDVE
jgi:hypothetical protein